jgi:hypothetical protein
MESAGGRGWWMGAIQNPKSKIQNALAPSGVLLKKVKHSMVCHPERSEGSLQSFSLANCGDASLRSA